MTNNERHMRLEVINYKYILNPTTDGIKKYDRIVKNEIECPKCFDMMTFCSDFDRLWYICDDCGFSLYTTRVPYYVNSS